ncbi:MAG: hypothetical protein HOP07_13890 [Bacteriovoracaceae bacterium]|nr:hypothetical protein [Bacteriovoracaceae bacterium]
MSMFLAFFVDQIQEISCYTFKKLVEKFKQKSSLWSSLTSAIEWVPLSSWDQFYYLLYYREMPPETG